MKSIRKLKNQKRVSIPQQRGPKREIKTQKKNGEIENKKKYNRINITILAGGSVEHASFW